MDAEIVISMAEDPELTVDKYSSFKLGVGQNIQYSHACFAHCQEFLPCPEFDPPCPFLHLSFFLSPNPLVLSINNFNSSVGLQNKKK